MGKSNVIEIKDLNKVFEGRGGSHHALRDVNLTIEDGDIFGIIGQSGAGKSTLVRCINLLERPTSGSIVIDGKDITDYQVFLKFKTKFKLFSFPNLVFF